MYIVPIAWLYVALMMAAAEATSSNGTVLGALITLVLYGLLPVGIVVYIMGTPARRRAIRAREAAQLEAVRTQADAHSGKLSAPLDVMVSGFAPDAGRHATTDPVAPVREEA